jgi:hypothetical protein
MAREKEKKGYQGPKLASDSKSNRDEARRRLERAQKNADGRQTNEMFALENAEFKTACTNAGANPTARQASKFRNGYGLAARAAGTSNRKDPRA